MTGVAPDEFREQVQDAIPDQDLDDIKRGFSDQADEQLENVQEKTEEIIEDAEDGDLLPDEQIIPLPESN